MNAKRLHGLILGGFLALAAIELLILPVMKIICGHAILPWLQK